MLWRTEDLVPASLLDNFPFAHHGNAIAQIPDHREIVGDEEN
jgi:hypothetical protein